MLKYPQFHDEVLHALERIGNARLGLHIAKERRSGLIYSGVRVPVRRKLVSQGFSFSKLEEPNLLEVWDDLWMHSPNGDVMFCALDYVRNKSHKNSDFQDWKTLKRWIVRVENWAHSDDLCSILSRYVESYFEKVLPDLKRWNRFDALWTKRISIVSLIHVGKNAVFLEPEKMFPFLRRCLPDHRDYMQKATGWVLRELHNVYPVETEAFVQENLQQIGPSVLTRTFEKLSKAERDKWRQLRKQLLA